MIVNFEFSPYLFLTVNFILIASAVVSPIFFTEITKAMQPEKGSINSLPWFRKRPQRLPLSCTWRMPSLILVQETGMITILRFLRRGSQMTSSSLGSKGPVVGSEKLVEAMAGVWVGGGWLVLRAYIDLICNRRTCVVQNASHASTVFFSARAQVSVRVK